MKRARIILPLFLITGIAIALVAINMSPTSGPGVRTVVQDVDGDSYTFFYQDSLIIDFVTIRPSREDTNIIMCVPAAFTNLNDGKIDGLFVDDGKINQRGRLNTTLQGAFLLTEGKIELMSTKNGSQLSDLLLAAISKKQGDLFQQVLLIADGEAMPLPQPKLFQRRAIVIMKSGEVAMVENEEAKTYAAFTNDLVGLGVQQALYLDMGAWDEGWYRDVNGTLHTIGQMRSATKRQSNWIVFKTEYRNDIRMKK